MGEFPLVLFTVLSQIAAGAAVTLALMDYFTDRVTLAAGKKATLSILIVTALSMGISLLHLGTPFSAYRALTNLTSSWLSREVVLFSVLLVLLVVYYRQWQADHSMRKTLGVGISVIAVLAVLSSAMVYVLPAVPAWNNLSTVIFFLFTAIVLGPLFVLTVIKTQDDNESAGMVKGTGIVLAAGFMTFLIYISVLLSSSDASALTAANMVGSGAFWLRILLNWVLPLAFLLWILAGKKIVDHKFVVSLFVLVLVGELLGRYLFYYSAVALRVAGL